MTSRKLPNYLRAYRRRCGLSQSDLAYIVKLSGKSEWCELERFHREPSYRTARACAKALGVPTSQLFAGIDVSTDRETIRRMRKLRSRLAAKADAAGFGQKFGWTQTLHV
jgi:transcriptional regulator with XRE-family HTH domain